MPRKTITEYDLALELASQLKQRAKFEGLDNYKPMPAQKLFHKSTKQGRIYSGGNRGGKTVGGGAEAVMWLEGRHPVHSKDFPPPVRGRIVAVDFDRGVELIVKPEIKRWIDPKLLINGKWEDSYHNATRILTLTNGSTCEFMSYDQDVQKFVGTSRHFCWFDEEPPLDIFNECLARLIDTNGRWWLTLTPLIDFSWTADTLYEPAKEGLLPDVELWEVNTKDNVHVDEDAADRLLSFVDAEEKEARLTGSGTSNSSLIYPDINKYIIDPLYGESWENVKENWTHFTMLDHGFRNPTAILFAAIDKENRIIVYDEIYVAGNLVKENAVLYNEKVKKLGITVDNMVGDPSTKNTDPITGTSIRIEYGDYGIWYELGNNDVQAGISRVKSAFQYGYLHITSNCRATIREARRYKWAKPISSKVAARRNLMEEPVKRDDHAMDALRYGIMSLPKFKEELDDELRDRLKKVGVAMDTAAIFEMANPLETQNKQQYDVHLGTEW